MSVPAPLNSLLLRDMNPSDLDRILNIEQQVHAYPWSRINFSDALDSGYLCKVYDEAHELSGYAVLMFAVDEVHLLNISVALHCQRSGLGRRLLHAVMGIARDRGMRRMLLEVRPSNVAALGLYKGVDFNTSGVRRDYYAASAGREDAIVMECLL